MPKTIFGQGPSWKKGGPFLELRSRIRSKAKIILKTKNTCNCQPINQSTFFYCATKR